MYHRNSALDVKGLQVMPVEKGTNRHSNHKATIDSIWCENCKDREITNIGTYVIPKSTNQNMTNSEKSGNEGIFLDSIRCSSGKVHELSCVGTADHSGSKGEQNKKDQMDNSENKSEKRRKPVTTSKDKPRQLTKNILSETTKKQLQNLQNISNDTEDMSAEKKKKKTKKHKKERKELISAEQNVKFAEILRKRLESELARRNDNHVVDNYTTVCKDENIEVKGKLVIDMKNDLSKHKTSKDVKTDKVTITNTMKTYHSSERYTNKDNESKQMPKSANQMHLKDRITPRSETEPKSANKMHLKDRNTPRSETEPKSANKMHLKDRNTPCSETEPKVANKMHVKDRNTHRSENEPESANKMHVKDRNTHRNETEPKSANKMRVKDRNTHRSETEPKSANKMHVKDRNTHRSENEPESANKMHVKDSNTHRSENEKQSKSKAKYTSEETLVKDIYKQPRKPTRIKSNKYFKLRYDSDHDENEGRPRKSSQYNPFPVNEMINGKFYRANSTKTSHSTLEQRHVYRSVSNASVFSSSIEVTEESPANLYSSYQNILFHSNTKDELYRQMGKKHQFSHVHDRGDKIEGVQNEPKVNANKTRLSHTTSKDNMTKTNANIRNPTDKNSRDNNSRAPKPRYNAWTIESTNEQVANVDARNNTFREKVIKAARRPQNRCFYSEDDDKDLILIMVQDEIQKQYQRIKEVRIKNELNQNDRQQEQNESDNRNKKNMKRDSKDPFWDRSKNCSAYKDDTDVYSFSRESDELQRLKVDTAKTDKKAKKSKFINETLNRVSSKKTEDSTEDLNDENKDVSTPMVHESKKEEDKLEEKKDMLQSIVDIHDIGVNVAPPHHAQQKVEKHFRVPSKKDCNKVVRVGGGWSNINDYYKRHVPVTRREYNRSSNYKGRSYLSFQSHYKCPPKLKHHSKVTNSTSRKVTLN
ncbi:uncharacterized protein LOC134687322 [Mytilus trossulus]|uniref:uncharacterized protein LOC134687322 n=1 Tax=Mytilus trossulus TaxID=6551 RepID=UPI003004A53F